MPTWKDANQILVNSHAIHELLLKSCKIKKGSEKKLIVNGENEK